MKQHYEMLQVHSLKPRKQLSIARGKPHRRRLKETQTYSRSLDRSESTALMKHLHSKFNSCVELRNGSHSNSK
uniref:Uncharacterized protein n=1 Tax=Lepeophtheirus salmonis TaxID=72036 RepID=A0A0K2VJ52_LEPSM